MNDAYDIIAEELASGNLDRGLWTRLFAECDGDETNTKVQYIKHRANQLAASHDKAKGESSEVAGLEKSLLTIVDATVQKADKESLSADEVRSPMPFAAGPWSRFLARNLDLTVSALVGSPLIYLTWRLVMLSTPSIGVGNAHLLFLALSAPWIFLADACIVGIFGTNLGKGLLRIKVLGVDGKPIGFAQACYRTSLLYLYGYWCCIPVISLIPHLLAYLRLSDGRSTAWDELGEFHVTRSPTGFIRGLLYLVSIALLPVLIGVALKAQINQFGGDNLIDQPQKSSELSKNSSATSIDSQIPNVEAAGQSIYTNLPLVTAYEFMKLPVVVAKAKPILGANYDKFLESTGLSGPVKKSDWRYFGSGCVEHMCGMREAAFDLEVNGNFYGSIFSTENSNDPFKHFGVGPASFEHAAWMARLTSDNFPIENLPRSWGNSTLNLLDQGGVTYANIEVKAGRCVGQVNGSVDYLSGVLNIHLSDGNTCKLALYLDKGRVHVIGSEVCGSYSGATCDFNGSAN